MSGIINLCDTVVVVPVVQRWQSERKGRVVIEKKKIKEGMNAGFGEERERHIQTARKI
jgi:hypothetical protein